MNKKISVDDLTQNELNEIFLGRKIVKTNFEELTIELDNGNIYRVTGNEGCGGCADGWFYITQLATTDNIITKAEIVEGKSQLTGEGAVQLFVFHNNERINAIEAEGSYGNGHYGGGFHLQLLTK